MKQLPETLSGLIRLAVADLERAEADQGYEVNMITWHEPKRRRCAVCMAGAVIAFSLEGDPTEELGPNDFGRETNAKLRAINLARTGELSGALQQMKRYHTGFGHRPVPTYDANPTAFKAAMLGIATELEASGL